MTKPPYRYDKESGYIFLDAGIWGHISDAPPNLARVIETLFAYIEDTNTRLESKERQIEMYKSHLELRDMTDKARSDVDRFDYDW